jgi:DNA modification methylase
MILNANALHIPLASATVQTCVTSPPYYGLRRYLEDDDPNKDLEIGLEETPELYVAKLVAVFREVWRVLVDGGTLWLNLGDSYTAGGSNRNGIGNDDPHWGGENSKRIEKHTKKLAAIDKGCKPKDLLGIPWMVAFALRADGWYLRSDIIWHKPNPMPESVTDRPTKSHEYIFLLSKSQKYYYDAVAIAEPAKSEHFGRYKYDFWPEGTKEAGGNGRPNNAANTSGKKDVLTTRNKRDVWTVNTYSYAAAHFATFPPKLIEPCILAGSKENDIVLDPFSGSGTTVMVAEKFRRRGIGLDLNWDYIGLSRERTTTDVMLPMFTGTQP